MSPSWIEHVMKRFIPSVIAAAVLLVTALPAQTPDTVRVAPHLSTTPVMFDADDPALWINPAVPESSLVLGTDKGELESGGLYVWNMDGSLRQQIPLGHPNNVDVKAGMPFGAATIDIAVVSVRDQDEIRVFKIDPDTRMLEDITTAQGIPVFDAPYGLTLYRRADDHRVFVILSSKSNNFFLEIWQIRLAPDDAGKVKGDRVRVFGDHTGIVEGMVADDELGYLYYAEGEIGIHKYYADPRKGARRLALLGTDPVRSWDRKGLALYKCSDSTGYLLVANPDDRCLHVYSRNGGAQGKHQHDLLAIIQNTLNNQGVGIEATSAASSARFPSGVLLWHDEKFRKFRYYAWEDVAQSALTVCSRTLGVAASGPPAAVGQPLRLFPNHPNPFNPQTAIRLQLAQPGLVRLRIYDVLGRSIRTLREEIMPGGEHTVLWDGKDEQQESMPSGVYFYKAEYEEFVQMRKMMLLR